jgi:hypothetical protein
MEQYSEYEIRESVKRHLGKIKSSEVIKDFTRRNEFKNPRTQKLDIECVDYLLGEIQKLANGLVLCNANQVVKLKEAHDHLEAKEAALDKREAELIEFENTIVEMATIGISKRLDERRAKLCA